MKYLLRVSLISIALIASVFFWPAEKSRAQVGCPGSPGCACTNSFDCLFGNICSYLNHTCSAFSMYVPPSTTSVGPDTYSQGLASNSTDGPVDLYSCLGKTASCNAFAHSDATQWQHQSGQDNYNYSFSNLRNSRGYNATLYAEDNFNGPGPIWKGSSSWTTLPDYEPGFSAQPGAGPFTASGATFNAPVGWTTNYTGSSSVLYSPNPPTWALEPQAIASSIALADVSAVNDGTAFAIGSLGKIMRRPSTGALPRDWTDVPSGVGSGLEAVDTFDKDHAWVVGLNGTFLIIYKNAISSTLSAPKNLWAVYSAKVATAWAVGDANTVVYFNGTSLVSKNATTPSVNLFDVTSVDDKEVWAVGQNGTITHSTNAGGSWSLPTTPLVFNSTQCPNINCPNLFSISTLDGVNLWASGDNALFHSTNSGASWTQVTIGVTGRLYDISQVNPNELWLNGGGVEAVKLIGTNSISLYPQAATVVGGSFNGLSVTTGGEVIVVGSNLSRASYSLLNAGAAAQTGADANFVGPNNHTVTLTSLVQNTKYYYQTYTCNPQPGCTGSPNTTVSIASAASGTFTTPVLDSLAPTISITAPTPQAFTNQSTITISGMAADETNLKSVTVVSTTAVPTTETIPATLSPAAGPGNHTWTANLPLHNGSLTRGINNVTVTADDGVHQVNATIQIIYDNQLPQVNFTQPNPWVVGSGSISGIQGHAGDNNPWQYQWNLASIEYAVDGGSRQAVKPFIAGSEVNFDTGPFTITTGTHTVTVYATDQAGNVGVGTLQIKYIVPDFSFTTNSPPQPNGQTNFAGSTFNYSFHLATISTYSGQISFALTGQPSGSTVTFSQNPVNLDSGSNPKTDITLAIATPAGASPGLYPMTVTAAGGPSHSVSIDLTLTQPPDFTLSVSPPSQTVVAGQKAVYTVSATGNSVYPANTQVNFSISGFPTNTSAAYAAGFVVIGPNTTKSDTVTITTTTTANPGTYTLVIGGGDGSIQKSFNATLIINPPPDFSLTVVPDPLTITAGGIAGTYNGNLTALNNFADTMQITATTTNAGITFAIAPNQFPAAPAPGTNFVINVTAASAVPGGDYVVTVTGSSSALTKSVQVTLHVKPDNQQPIITNVKAVAGYNTVTISWDTNEPADSLIGIFTDSSFSILSIVGTTADSSFCTTPSPPCHQLIYTPLNPLTTYYFLINSVDPAGNTGIRKFEDDGVTPQHFTTLDAPDTIPPTVVITQPQPNDQLTGTAIITGSATDDKFVAQIQLRIKNSGGQTVNSQVPTCTGTPTACTFQYSWNTLDKVGNSYTYPNGTYTITAIAYDKAPNPSAPFSVTVTVDNDTVAPSITDGPHAFPIPTNGDQTCGPSGTDQCWEAAITWTTNKASTSAVDYGLVVSSCNPQDGCTYVGGLKVQYDDNDTAQSGQPQWIQHKVTVKKLLPDKLYHYRITSCNISNICTH